MGKSVKVSRVEFDIVLPGVIGEPNVTVTAKNGADGQMHFWFEADEHAMPLQLIKLLSLKASPINDAVGSFIYQLEATMAEGGAN